MERLIEKMDFGTAFARREYVAIKTHFGSEGAHRIVRPRFLRVLADAVKAVGGKPFVCDTVRIQGWDYVEVANQNGINPQSVGCPVILAETLGVDGQLHIDAAAQIGLSSREYDLIRV